MVADSAVADTMADDAGVIVSSISAGAATALELCHNACRDHFRHGHRHRCNLHIPCFVLPDCLWSSEQRPVDDHLSLQVALLASFLLCRGPLQVIEGEHTPENK